MTLIAARRPWIVIACAAVIVTLSMGVRQAFGLFLPPMAVALDITRSEFGLAIAIQNLMLGLGQPFIGALADKHGAGRIAASGALLYVLGLAGAAAATSAFGIYLSLGFLIGFAMTGVTFTVMLGAVGRIAPPERRSLVFGIVTAGGSLGQFLVVPAAQFALGELGYRMALIALAGLIAMILALAIGVSGKPTSAENDGPAQSAREALIEARGQRSFWLLNAGFFVCGFHIAFIATHFPAYLTDRGLPLSTGASALALVGLFNIFGSYLFGAWGDVWRKHHVLAGLYAARSLVIVAFLMLPLSNVTALAFAAAMGFLWLGTVPLTNGLVSQIFGLRHLSMLGGIVFMSHQVGSFFGAWLAGRIYDSTGSYDAAWTASIILGFAAALIHLPIRDAPLRRLEATA